MTSLCKKYAARKLSLSFLLFVSTLAIITAMIALEGYTFNKSLLMLVPAYAQQQLLPSSTHIINAKLGTPFTLKFNDTAIIESSNVTLRFSNVTEDSRCPSNAECIIAGRVTVSIYYVIRSSTVNNTNSIYNNNNITKESPFSSVKLTLGSPLSSNESASKEIGNGFVVNLTKVEPHPQQGVKIDLKDYNVTLIVSKVEKEEEAAEGKKITSILSLPIPRGIWDINSNGLPGKLNIISIDNQGNLQGTISLYPYNAQSVNQLITGYADGESGKVTFIRQIGPNPNDVEVYTGYTFSNIIADCITGTGPGSCFDHMQMAGIFESFYHHTTTNNNTFAIIGTFPDAHRNSFGWYASHEPQPCPACPG